MNQKNFIILGMPRSMTAWLSCFLTCGPVFCQHELSSKEAAFEGFVRSIREQPFDFSGISDPAAILWWRDIVREMPDATLIYVRRSPRESRVALARVAQRDPGDYSQIYESLWKCAGEFLQEAEPHVVEYASLTSAHSLRTIWKLCAPGMALPEAHLRKMLTLHVRQRDDLILRASSNAEGVPKW